MTPEEMLRTVSEHGEDAGSDYNDGLDGWFGFTIDGDNVMTVTFTPANEDGEADVANRTSTSWRVVRRW